ncbi:MAG: SPFH domain-containing protein, partial [bacterium]
RIAKAGPNEVLIISGSPRTYRDEKRAERKGFRLVKGGSTFYFPLINKLDRLSLELITLDVQPPAMRTMQGVPIQVDGIAQIKVKGDDYSISTAAEQFLSKTKEEIQRIALRSVEGHLRAILGTLTVEEVYSNKEAFAEKVQEVSAADLANMGLAVISFTIREIHDENGYLDAIGKPEIAKRQAYSAILQAEARRDAEIKVKQAESESAIKSAQARQSAEQARFDAEAAIAATKSNADAVMGSAKFVADSAIAQSERDYNLRLASYDAESNRAKAEAELAYDLQRFTTQQKVKEQELQVQVIEKEKQLEIQMQEIKRREKELEATVSKPAEAERLRIQTLADAEKYQLEVTAQGASSSAKLRGFADAEVEKAQAEARKVQGLIEAEIAEARGRAEAEVLRAKGLAEAEVVLRQGEAEAQAMRLRAEAWKEYGSAAILEMFIEKLPEIARAIAEPLAKTDKIVMINYGGGSGSGPGGSSGMASAITGEVTSIISQLPPVLEALTGMNFADLMQKLPGLKERVDGAATAVAEEIAPLTASPSIVIDDATESLRVKPPIVKPATPEPPLK